MQETIYGIRIVPYRDDNKVNFGMFEGIVISCSLSDFDKIEISKMVNRNNGYFVDSWISIPYEDVIAHSNTSGKAKAEFLISKAKELAKENGEIAICDTLVPHLSLLDFSYENLQKILKEQN